MAPAHSHNVTRPRRLSAGSPASCDAPTIGPRDAVRRGQPACLPTERDANRERLLPTTRDRRADMIWALLAVIGVPLWLCAAPILSLLLRNRALRSRPGNVPVRVKRPGKKHWSP